MNYKDEDKQLPPRKSSIIKTNIQYFSPALQEMIERIPEYPVTLLEAASGYGKTTCIHHFFSSYKDADVHWVSFSIDETAEKAWERYCNVIKKADLEVGQRLFSLGLPSSHNIDEICQLLHELCCDEETYLIFDNFQYMQEYFSKAIWEAFLFNHSKFLHIIAITHMINKESEFLTTLGKCLYISSEDLRLNKNDISEYFKKAGVMLKSYQVDFLDEYSEGWIAPLYLQLLHFSKTMKFEKQVPLNAMIEKAILNIIDEEQKKNLVSLSIFHSFTSEQLIFLSRNNFASSLEKVPFLSFNRRHGTYTFHSILREVLQIEFTKLSTEEQSEIISKSAQWYVKISDYPNAILLYDRIEDYQKILPLIKDSSVFDHISLRQTKEIYLNLLRKIAFTEIENRMIIFPEAFVLIAFEFFTQNCYQEYGEICESLHKALEQGKIQKKLVEKIQGELALIESFKGYNNISEMGRYYEKAFEWLKGKCSSITPRDPWTFGNPSIVSLYWSEVGKLDSHIKDMTKFILIYSAIVTGHGTGADVIFQAEIALHRGEDSLAENLYYKGIFQSKSAHQESLYLSAVFGLIRIAIIRGDKAMYELCMTYLVESEKNRAVHYELSEIALIESYIRLQFNTIKQKNLSAQNLLGRILPMTEPYGYCLMGRELLLQGKFLEVQILYEEALEVAEGLHSQLTRLYFEIYMAVAKLNNQQMTEAIFHLIETLNRAIPDQIMLPFAENYDLLQELFGEVPEAIPKQVAEFCKKYKRGLQTLRKTLYSKEVLKELTPMEYEVYQLAVEKKKNKEIAKELFISENTIKTHLAHIYSKLGVKSKFEL